MTLPPPIPEFIHVYKTRAGRAFILPGSSEDPKHDDTESPERGRDDSHGCPVRRPRLLRRRGARRAVRAAGRRRAVPELPLLQPVRVLRRHRPVLRRRLPEPVRRLRPQPARPGPGRPRRGLRRAAGPLRASAPPPQRRGVVRARVLHLRRVHRRGGRVPGLRHDGRARAEEARGRRVPGPDLPRDHRRVAHRARRPLLVGILLQGGAADRPVEGLHVLHAVAGLAVRAGQEVLRPRPHPAHPQLQLRAGGARHRPGPPEQPGARGGGRRGVVQDGAVVLDDAAGQQAVVPRRHHGPVDAVGRRQERRPGARVRRHHQHHQRRDRVRARLRHARRGPDRLLQALLRRLRHRIREQPRLRRAEAVQRRVVVGGDAGGAVKMSFRGIAHVRVTVWSPNKSCEIDSVCGHRINYVRLTAWSPNKSTNLLRS